MTSRCLLCNDPRVSDSLGVCASCLKGKESALEVIAERRKSWRRSMGLPEEIPREGVKCNLCANECSIPDGERGYCGTIINDGGRLRPITGSWRVATGLYYLDPLPTNCVANPVCPATTCRGYPEYTQVCGPEYGMYNLAIFYGSCNIDCFFCQNADHKTMAARGRPVMTLESLIRSALRDDVPCICAFGGDPGPWTPQLFLLYRRLREKSKGIKRMCWETNGLENEKIFLKMAELSLTSGGIVKVDFKAWTPQMFEALTGVRGRDRVLENLKNISKLAKEREEPPLLVVSTLMVPYYLDLDEIRGISGFLAALDVNIPYILLGFHPHHLAKDMPFTSRKFAEEAYKVAKEQGLKEVYIENQWLLV